jgi:citrate synthase
VGSSVALDRRAPDGCVVLSGLEASTFYQDNSLDPAVRTPQHVEMSTIRLLAKMPTIAAYAHTRSRWWVSPSLLPHTPWATSTTSCGFSAPAEDYVSRPGRVQGAELLLFPRHADHEQNRSTFTVMEWSAPATPTCLSFDLSRW